MHQNDSPSPEPSKTGETSSPASSESRGDYSEISPEGWDRIFRNVKDMQDQGVIGRGDDDETDLKDEC